MINAQQLADLIVDEFEKKEIPIDVAFKPMMILIITTLSFQDEKVFESVVTSFRDEYKRMRTNCGYST